MTWTTLAEAGPSECARTEMDCMPGFGLFLALGAFAALGIVAILTLSTWAALSIIDSNIAVSNKVVWSLLVWAAPVVGAIAWFARTTTSDECHTGSPEENVCDIRREGRGAPGL